MSNRNENAVGNAVQYILNRGSVILVTNVETRTYSSGSPEYDEVKGLIASNDDAGLYSYVNGLKAALEKVYEGFTVENEIVFVDGEALPAPLSRRVKAFADDGAPYKYLLKFWENLKKNPSYRSVNSLFNFLESTHCPIDVNGNIQCFKAVNAGFKDKHTNTIDNSPGTVVKMERRLISDDPAHGCHVGLHAGCLDYVKGFGSQRSGDKVIEVVVNPAHVVCVPNDCSFGKMRVEEYTVIREVPWDTIQPTAQTYANPYAVGEFSEDEDDDDYDDTEDDDVWEDGDDEDWDDDDDLDDLDDEDDGDICPVCGDVH